MDEIQFKVTEARRRDDGEGELVVVPTSKARLPFVDRWFTRLVVALALVAATSSVWGTIMHNRELRQDNTRLSDELRCLRDSAQVVDEETGDMLTLLGQGQSTIIRGLLVGRMGVTDVGNMEDIIAQGQAIPDELDREIDDLKRAIASRERALVACAQASVDNPTVPTTLVPARNP